MEPRKTLSMGTSWTQSWSKEYITQSIMDDTQLEIIVQDMLFDEEDTAQACRMLNEIGIRT